MNEITKWLKKIFTIQFIAGLATIIGTYYGYKTYVLNKEAKENLALANVEASAKIDTVYKDTTTFLKSEKEEFVDDEYNIKELIQAANRGDDSAQCSLALKYYEGEGVEKDIPRSVSWFLKSIKSNPSGDALSLVIIIAMGNPTFKTIWNDSCSKYRLNPL